MDKHTLEGRVVAERVRHGVRWNILDPFGMRSHLTRRKNSLVILIYRYQEPVDLADIAPLPDFKLIPREEEAEVCRFYPAVANQYLIFLNKQVSQGRSL